jgi:hypothetical protein
MVPPIVIRTIKIAVEAPTTAAFIVAARWPVALLSGAEPQSVDEVRTLPIVLAEACAVADTELRLPNNEETRVADGPALTVCNTLSGGLPVLTL